MWSKAMESTRHVSMRCRMSPLATAGRCRPVISNRSIVCLPSTSSILRSSGSVAGLRTELPDISLVLAGSKRREYESCRRAAVQLGVADRVHFLGYVCDEDVHELYRRARALVMPTFFGPTNIPPLEAFAAGCPVAVSKVYGMPAQVGDAALLFDPESVASIAEAIRRLWTDDGLCAMLKSKGMERHKARGEREFNGRFAEIIRTILLRSRC